MSLPLVAGGLGLVAPGIVGVPYRCFRWLKDGIWPEITLSTLGLERIEFSWVGLQKIADFLVFDTPIEFIVMGISYIVVHLSVSD